MALGINIKYHRFFVLCYSVVVVIFQNYDLSKRFDNLITRRDKIRFSLEKRIIRHVFTCLSKLIIIWASSRENLSSGFPTKRVLNQSPQLQRLARKLKFHLYQVYI